MTATRRHAMPELPVLDARTLNRTMLARQGLLTRADATIPEAVRAMGGVQAQYAPSIYVGLWSRMTQVTRNAVTEALHAREIVQGTLHRSTIHVVTRADYWAFALAVREARRRWYLTLRREPESRPAAAAERVAQLLSVEGQASRAALEAAAGPGMLLGAGLWVDLVRVPPAGTWEHRRADIFALAEDWVGPPDTTVTDAPAAIVRRYLEAFGPAPMRDIAAFAGVRIGDVRNAVQQIAPRRFRAVDGRELVDVDGGEITDAATPVPVRFLPTWDTVLLAHNRRAGILPEHLRPRVFSNKNPQSLAVFTLDGVVAGSWRWEHGAIVTSPFEPLDRAARREVDAEAERLAEFHG